MAGLTLDIGMNTRDAIKGAGDLEKSLEDVADSLDGVAREGDDSAEKLERSFAEAAREISQDAKKAGNDIGDQIRTGTRHAGEGMTTFKDEAKQSIRETAASVKDLSSGLDAVQEIAANAFIGFGPAGLVAGATAAAGLGLVSEGIRQAQADADELKEHLLDAFREAADEGRNFLNETQIITQASDILFDPKKREAAYADARAFGLDAITIARAMSGDEEALNTVLERGEQLRQQALDKASESKVLTEDALNADAAVNIILDKRLSTYETQAEYIKQNKEGAELVLLLQGKSTEEIQKQNKALAETPREITTKLSVDTSELDRKLAESRTLKVNIEGYVARSGVRVV